MNAFRIDFKQVIIITSLLFLQNKIYYIYISADVKLKSDGHANLGIL